MRWNWTKGLIPTLCHALKKMWSFSRISFGIPHVEDFWRHFKFQTLLRMFAKCFRHVVIGPIDTSQLPGMRFHHFWTRWCWVHWVIHCWHAAADRTHQKTGRLWTVLWGPYSFLIVCLTCNATKKKTLQCGNVEINHRSHTKNWKHLT